MRMARELSPALGPGKRRAAAPWTHCAQLDYSFGRGVRAVVVDAMLLCAGLGTRLRPLTDERPKPVVPVLGRPLASYALAVLAGAGVRHVVANTHHLADQVLPALAPYAQKYNLAIEAVHEPELLGTGGG